MAMMTCASVCRTCTIAMEHQDHGGGVGGVGHSEETDTSHTNFEIGVIEQGLEAGHCQLPLVFQVVVWVPTAARA
jgi:hypothetical protein